jgi:hypothetical protein
MVIWEYFNMHATGELLGDLDVYLDGQVVGNGLSKHTFICSESCSSSSISQPAMVIWEYFNMHATGERQSNELLHGGGVIHTAAVNYFDFHQQVNIVVQQTSFIILPGDSFRTT